MRWGWLILVLAVVPMGLLAGAPQVDVRALMPDRVVVEWQGGTHRLAVGDAVQGLELISADSEGAVFAYRGERFRRGLGTTVGGAYAEPAPREVRIRRDRRGMYRTRGRINGRAAELLVDTGANVVAMGRGQAEALGIDLDGATRRRVATASGRTTGHEVRLDRVTIGGLSVRDVRAVVIDGAGPPAPLLGMSFLGRVNMRQEGDVMILRSVP